jgi:hypothetical protein
MHREKWQSPKESESWVVFYMFDRLNNLVDQLHGHSRNDPLSFREGTLKGTKSYPRLLRGNSRKQLNEKHEQGGDVKRKCTDRGNRW